MEQDMHIEVTGANGFVGRALVIVSCNARHSVNGALQLAARSGHRFAYRMTI
ncbi:hypothetical protein D8I24_5569 [Cupriavidus necator H850]|nr:hypothetical protein D8I24_5569 [Cupriavidus necator H850]